MCKTKVVPYLVTGIGYGPDPGFLAVIPQVTLVINLVVGCHYFPPGPRLLSHLMRSPCLAGIRIYCLVTEAHSVSLPLKLSLLLLLFKFFNFWVKN